MLRDDRDRVILTKAKHYRKERLEIPKIKYQHYSFYFKHLPSLKVKSVILNSYLAHKTLRKFENISGFYPR